jgi:hypothetical protein
MKAAASALESAGFTVLRVGRFAVSVEGEESRFQSCLGLHRSGSHVGTQELHPPDRRLASFICAAEVLPAPELL